MRFILLLLSLMIFACSPKIVDKVEPEKQTQSKTPVDQVGEANINCISFSNLGRVDREEAETAYVLYKDQMRLNKYDRALPIWRTAFKMAPAANGRVKYHFDDGIALYKFMYNQTEDKKLKQSYMDTILSIYDKRKECFGEEYYIAGRKAFDMYYSFNEFSDEDLTFKLFKEAIDGKAEESDYFIINPFTKLLYDRIVNKSISIEEGALYANLILKIVKTELSNCKDNCEAWEIINEYAPPRLEALEGIEDFYSCDYYTSKYYNQFIAKPEDCENISEVYRKLLWGKCDLTDAFVIEVKNAIDEHCYTPPPPEGPLKRAFNAYNEGKFRDAIQLFEEFVNRTEDLDKKGRYTLLIAKIFYRDIKDFSKARAFALEAAKYKSDWGEPYMLIGKLYASSGPLCGPGRGWDSQIVTWPAIDKFIKAKTIDPSFTAEANEWINRYSKYMPSVEDVFQRPTINEGSRFFVPCWIQEWTTVRVARK